MNRNSFFFQKKKSRHWPLRFRSTRRIPSCSRQPTTAAPVSDGRGRQAPPPLTRRRDMAPPPLTRREFVVNACAGGVAGCTVDLVLFPLDTLKTVLQLKPDARQTHLASFSPRRFYRGLSSAMLGSFPSAAVFFSTCALESVFFCVSLSRVF